MSDTMKCSVTVAAPVGGSLAEIRKAIADPQWEKWLPFIKSAACDGAAAGASRVCILSAPGTAMDDYELHERIKENDAGTGRFVYAIENPPLPVAGLVSTVESSEVDGKVMISWTAVFDAEPTNVEAARQAVIGMYSGGIAALDAYACAA